jgi:hypothetical protein
VDRGRNVIRNIRRQRKTYNGKVDLEKDVGGLGNNKYINKNVRDQRKK